MELVHKIIEQEELLLEKIESNTEISTVLSACIAYIGDVFSNVTDMSHEDKFAVYAFALYLSLKSGASALGLEVEDFVELVSDIEVRPDSFEEALMTALQTHMSAQDFLTKVIKEEYQLDV